MSEKLTTLTTLGINGGALFAAIISWSMWKSFWWMLIHSICGWLYIIYWAIKY